MKIRTIATAHISCIEIHRCGTTKKLLITFHTIEWGEHEIKEKHIESRLKLIWIEHKEWRDHINSEIKRYKSLED